MRWPLRMHNEKLPGDELQRLVFPKNPDLDHALDLVDRKLATRVCG